MKVKKDFVILWLLFSAFCVFSQKPFVWKNDTINTIDNQGLKQGKWLFFDSDQQPKMLCVFKNDSLAGNKILFIDTNTMLVREPKKGKIEKFTYISAGQKHRGWFDKRGTVIFDNPKDSILSDSVVQYFYGLPAMYAFGSKNINDDVDIKLKPLRKQLTDCRITIDVYVKSNGMVSKIDVKLDTPNPRLEAKVKKLILDMDRWQPAFNTWETTVSKNQIVLKY